MADQDFDTVISTLENATPNDRVAKILLSLLQFMRVSADSTEVQLYNLIHAILGLEVEKPDDINFECHLSHLPSDYYSKILGEQIAAAN
ncbi:hypothetical protein SNOG_12983 [Parastagonospora nodorum SN15]|uniref:Uncharacterized protein n=1 Tax=Phaeosphaeria nodorum (strain SN15 / ATCC MYA-4574 / FGSC 10173) TaxID=321614 RepID=Q0U5I1_PHANO|nr:hypothetical protein SNOG_12983 [Parastagonospora nodorum SN15]EAT79783.1 hypothetical protein SNOG_12983 [Parastagonospora nodorum SN15]